MDVQLGMIVIYARDLAETIQFYRSLGLDIPDPAPERPGVIFRMRSGISMVFTTGDVAGIYDDHWERGGGVGYQQMLEFVVPTDDDVEVTWTRLVSAGYHGRTTPRHINGPFAAMVDDPDGNAVLISSDVATLNGIGAH